MHSISQRARIAGGGLGLLACGVLAGPAFGVDLAVSTVIVNQSVNYGTTDLIAGNATIIRGEINVNDSPSSVSNVDAVLRVFVDGVEMADSPFFSINGPITASLNPALTNLNSTVNFYVILPESDDVDFFIEVNPFQTVVETNYDNNTRSKLNQDFVCKDVTEVVYVPINYTPGGGLPSASLIEPGIGDGFLRAIGSPAEWNYHESPLPTFTWTQNINQSNNALLNSLASIRSNTLPANGYPVPAWVYGWLPGNPFNGNGQANGIPGTAAFGNTQTVRHQRTMAHEIGHCVGLSHNGSQINTIGIDVEHHLKDTENLSQIFIASKNDIMVAGQLTNTAFVRSQSYEAILNNGNVVCSGDNDAAESNDPIYRIQGIMTHTTRTVQFDHAMWIARGGQTRSARHADMAVRALDADGKVIHEVAIATGTCRESCCGKDIVYDESPFEATIPVAVNDVPVMAIQLVDIATGNLLGEQVMSEAPVVDFTGLTLIDAPMPGAGDGRGMLNGDRLVGTVLVEWNAIDPDGDDLRYNLLYSPDKGASWTPLTLRTAETSFEYHTSDVAAAFGSDGLLRVIASDGLSNTIVTSVPLALGGNNVPDTFLITPNANSTFPQHAGVIFHASSWDKEDLLLGGSNLVWTSNLDGEFGTGQIFVYAGLSAGTHTITVTATDFDGGSRTDTVTLTITERDFPMGPDADLDNDGSVNADDLAILLANWGDSPINGDLNGDGVVDAGDLAILLSQWTG